MAAAEIAEATEALARLRPQLLALNRFGFRVWGLEFDAAWRICGLVLRQCNFECIAV